MRISVSTGGPGDLTRPDAVVALAAAAEQLGYAGLWALDGDPRDGPARPPHLGPLGVVAAAAAATRVVRLGAVLGAPEPAAGVVVAGMAAGLAAEVAAVWPATAGRLSVALEGGAGEGAVGHLLDLLGVPRAATPGPAEGRPPVLVAGTAGAALELAAVRADGWCAAGLGPDDVAVGWARVRSLAAGRGRDPDGLRLVVRADATVTDRPLAPGRARYRGSAEQVAADVAAAHRVGASEVVVVLAGGPTLDQLLDAFARIAEALAG